MTVSSAELRRLDTPVTLRFSIPSYIPLPRGLTCRNSGGAVLYNNMWEPFLHSLQPSLAGQPTGLLTWSPLNRCLKGGERIIQDIDPISRRLKEAEQKIRILYEIARIVSSLLDVQLVLDAIVNLLWKEFNLDACSIRLLDTDGKLRIKSQQGLSKAFIEEATREPTIDSYSGDCFLTGKIVIINDADHMDKPISTTRTVGENIKSFAVTPIQVEGETIGVLVTSSKKKNYFHERFNDVIYVISNQIGIAIRISKLLEEIHSINLGLEQKVRNRTAELEEKTQQLIAVERLATVGEMSKRIAHELRNSLTVVGGLARRLHGKSTENDPDREYLKIIFEEVETLEKKVSNLIKLGAGEEIRASKKEALA